VLEGPVVHFMYQLRLRILFKKKRKK
jgi:hypothetical protein